MDAVWVNELGGVTFASRSTTAAEYVKVYPDRRGAPVDRRGAAAALGAALHAGARRARVRDGVAAHRATAGPLGGGSALGARTPRRGARAIGAGLRLLHDALPVADCPFGRPSWVPDDAPPADRLVVCHGDACAPNTLMADDGTCSGHVDLGDLGVADRWADLAIATQSLDWNYPSREVQEDSGSRAARRVRRHGGPSTASRTTEARGTTRPGRAVRLARASYTAEKGH